jgi:hypothetical protein
VKTLATLKEHIDLLRKLYIPYKYQLVKYVAQTIIEHYSQARNALVDTTNNETLTIDQFIEAIIKPEAKP